MALHPRKMYTDLLNAAGSAPLSEVFANALQLAHLVNDKEFIKWLNLEIGGYFNSNAALSDDVVVPAYRTISGQYCDDAGNVLRLTDANLGFVNQSRLRNGIAELEVFSHKEGWLTIRDVGMLEVINRNLNVNVTSFRFTNAEVVAILATLRGKLIERLSTIRKAVEAIPDSEEGPSVEVVAKTGSGNMKVKLEILAAVLTIVGSAIGLFSYFGTSKKQPTEKPLSAGSSAPQITNSPTINILNNNSGGGSIQRNVSEKEAPKQKREVPRKRSAADHATSQAERLQFLKAQYSQQYSDIYLCDAEERQSNVAKYTQALAAMEEIKEVALKANDTPTIAWVKKMTCDGMQNVGGIGHAEKR